jgi:hypothetical protein
MFCVILICILSVGVFLNNNRKLIFCSIITSKIKIRASPECVLLIISYLFNSLSASAMVSLMVLVHPKCVRNDSILQCFSSDVSKAENMDEGMAKEEGRIWS